MQDENDPRQAMGGIVANKCPTPTAPAPGNIDNKNSSRDLELELLNSLNSNLLYNTSGYPYPRTAIPKPLLQIQANLYSLRLEEKNYNPIVDYGYPPPPPPPKPPLPPELSPLCSPCPSDDSEEDDSDLLDIEALPPDYQFSPTREERDETEALKPPPLPPDFPWPDMPLSPPPAPPQFPWAVPAGPAGPGSPGKKELPEALKNLCQPLFCKLCTLNLPSKIVSRNHYQRSRRHKIRVNKWLKENNCADFLLYVPPRVVRRSWKPKIVVNSSQNFEWKETESEDAVTDPFLPKELQHLCQTLKCSVCDTKHFSRTHAMDHYGSREHQFEVKVFLGLVKRPVVPVPVPAKRRRDRRSYWSWMKRHHLGSFANNRPRNVASNGGQYNMQIPTLFSNFGFERRQEEFSGGAGFGRDFGRGSNNSNQQGPQIIWRERPWH